MPVPPVDAMHRNGRLRTSDTLYSAEFIEMRNVWYGAVLL